MLGTKADDSWRENIKVGDVVDALDNTFQWYKATVIELIES